MGLQMKKIALAVTLLLLGTGTSLAADMAVKARPMPVPVPVYSWSGCYIGVNGGGIWSDSNRHVQPTGQYLVDPNFATRPDLLAYVTQDYRVDRSGGTAGGQIGCNYQSGSWVFGLEGDAEWTGINDSFTATYPQTPFFNGFSFLPRTLTVTHQLDGLATVRGRLGYAFDRLLVYGTGGLAIGRVRSSFFQNFFTAGITDVGSASETRVGWTVGAGLEYAFSGNWSAKAEYLYVDLGSFSYNSPASDDPRYLWTTTVKTREHIGRVGINYHFNGPVVAKY
jgi:outer membrane immunogenic protein